MYTFAKMRTDHSDIYTKVEERVLCQLMEAVIYEEIVLPRKELFAKRSAEENYALPGTAKSGESVAYVFSCKQYFTFERVRIERGSVRRIDARGERAKVSLPLFVQEVLGQVQSDERLAILLEELEQTLLKDFQAQIHRSETREGHHPAAYDDWESLLDGHPYHPCYKSRIGFHLKENEQYGPEFQANLQPVWLAVAKSESLLVVKEDIDYPSFIEAELGFQSYQDYVARMHEKGLDVKDYWIMPVHPWQWENIILPTFHSQLAEQKIVQLGFGKDYYRAQQSIRSWANAVHREKSYMKLSLNITNTSTRRMLAKHTVMNAPLVTNWLLTLTAQDEVARKLDFPFLGEFAGVSYDYEKLPAAVQLQAYGSLGVVWRQSVHRFLKEDEQAFPFHALSLIYKEKPMIDKWVRQYGLEVWTRQLLDVTVTPLIHMLYAHGLALESHAQNIVLIHKNGWPSRVALKDFHDGVRFSKAHLPRPDLCPDLNREPAHHRALNRHSYMQTDDLAAVKDFLHSAFFFVCLSELGIFLHEQYALSEQKFWGMVAEVIYSYQEDYPEHQQNFEWYDLFSPTILIEQLARRRMWKDTEVEPKPVPNPLYYYRSLRGGEA
ncbi:IucA/IucC family protein [Brevibacillus nitrificans]|uniref:IucA/IucC family protein n=1 Tax=Brevibacillus nitrificans TaxID=651560 RepID=UPI0026386199|nr:IucA/IucC family protein [Brevibacillus nitrificans]